MLSAGKTVRAQQSIWLVSPKSITKC